MATMNPDEEIKMILDILDELLDGIEPDDYHAGPADDQAYYGAQSTGSLRSPGCSSQTVSSPSTGSLTIGPAHRFARTAPGQQNTRHCAYIPHNY